jgi:hypothetical protein
MHITTIGLDLAKHWFQIHGVDAAGKIAVKRRLRRNEVVAFFRRQEPCLVGMEACATAHHWARELIALGHEVKLMPRAYPKQVARTDAMRAFAFPQSCIARTSFLQFHRRSSDSLHGSCQHQNGEDEEPNSESKIPKYDPKPASFWAWVPGKSFCVK